LWELWRDSQRTGQQLWGGLVVNYNAQEQTDLWDRLRSPAAGRVFTAALGSVLVLAAVGALTWAGTRWRGRARRRSAQSTAPAAAGYARLLALLARHARLRPRLGQTPREFAVDGRRFLLAAPAAQPFANLPDEIVDQLYQVRFGGHSLSSNENAAVAARLDQLAAALKSGRG
jgi:hypothetical protein